MPLSNSGGNMTSIFEILRNCHNYQINSLMVTKVCDWSACCDRPRPLACDWLASEHPPIREFDNYHQTISMAVATFIKDWKYSQKDFKDQRELEKIGTHKIEDYSCGIPIKKYLHLFLIFRCNWESPNMFLNYYPLKFFSIQDSLLLSSH